MNPMLLNTALLASAMTLAVGSLVTPKIARADPLRIDAAQVTTYILAETNRYRASKGSPALVADSALASAAQQYAEFQARTNTSGHTADGRSPGDRIAAASYQACRYAENVFEYWSQPNVPTEVAVREAAMKFWINSPGHEANLRDPALKHLGVGVAAASHNGRNYFKVVQNFGDDCGRSPAGHAATPSVGDTSVLKPARSGAVDAIRAALGHCKPGYVDRLANASDRVCVTESRRAYVAVENRLHKYRVEPNGGFYGPNTCRVGFVWREAFAGDVVCVRPVSRDYVFYENSVRASREQ